jgi:hypothetical protein
LSGTFLYILPIGPDIGAELAAGLAGKSGLAKEYRDDKTV